MVVCTWLRPVLAVVFMCKSFVSIIWSGFNLWARARPFVAPPETCIDNKMGTISAPCFLNRKYKVLQRTRKLLIFDTKKIVRTDCDTPVST